MDLNKGNMKKLLLVVCSAILLYCALQNIEKVVAWIFYVIALFMPILVGLAIAFIFNVPMSLIERKLFSRVKNRAMLRLKRVLAYVITLVFVVGILAIVLLVVIPELAETITKVVKQIPVMIESIQVAIKDLNGKWPELEKFITSESVNWDQIMQEGINFFKNSASGVFSSGIGFISSMVNGVTTFFIGFAFSIYVLFQKEKLARQFKHLIYALLPKAGADKVIHVSSLSYSTFSSFLSGQCLEAVILGSMFFISMTLLRMPYALLMGVLITVTALIPMVGAFIGCAIGIFLIAMISPLQAVFFVILFLVLQQIEGNLIYPHVVGNSVGLPSIWVLAAVTLGGKLMGISGMLIFIPLCSVFYALLREFIRKRLREKKILKITRDNSVIYDENLNHDINENTNKNETNI